MMEISDIGLIGLAVMGENLALNLESKGYTVSVYNRVHPDRESVVTRFVEGRGKGEGRESVFTGPIQLKNSWSPYACRGRSC